MIFKHVFQEIIKPQTNSHSTERIWFPPSGIAKAHGKIKMLKFIPLGYGLAEPGT